jgi:hypothetical protein
MVRSGTHLDDASSLIGTGQITNHGETKPLGETPHICIISRLIYHFNLLYPRTVVSSMVEDYLALREGDKVLADLQVRRPWSVRLWSRRRSSERASSSSSSPPPRRTLNYRFEALDPLCQQVVGGLLPSRVATVF